VSMISLPGTENRMVAATDSPSRTAMQAPRHDRSGIRILMLDDEPFMLKLLDRMLRNLDYQNVMPCESGRAALLIVDDPAQRPDLILLDINMPAMDGAEFVRHLVEHDFRGAIILVSGEDERVLQSVEKLVRAHQITVLGRLSKPVSPQQLAAALTRWQPCVRSAAPTARKDYGADELRAALEQGDLLNYYQPKVRVATGEVIGVETLVRWRHPKDGLLLPNRFVGVAEQHGLIHQLTRVVMRAAFAQARLWQDAGLVLRVAVNLSMDNLSDLSFLDDVVDLAQRAGVLPQQLVLELTESRLMSDQRVPLEVLTRLRLKRFRLSIDDFGTGNSSLTQLRDIPFDELKIDQSFVHGACGNETQRAMFDASLGLARQLRMEAVAEGVQDHADWNFLRERGCDLAQGYFIARPMPAEDLPAWLVDWEQRRARLSLR
jgi:EAL domain-containing protein (putative c-di-GMP-specific phosphodiesterase class I)/CheY-like chemotaxis protein